MKQFSYPVRLRRVLILTAPLWFRASFRMLRGFIQDQLRDKVNVLRPSPGTKLDALSHPDFVSLRRDHYAWLQTALVRTGWLLSDSDQVCFIHPSFRFFTVTIISPIGFTFIVLYPSSFSIVEFESQCRKLHHKTNGFVLDYIHEPRISTPLNSQSLGFRSGDVQVNWVPVVLTFGVAAPMVTLVTDDNSLSLLPSSHT